MFARVVDTRIGDIPSVILAGPYTLTATRDPTTTDDITANWQVGSVWFNAAAGYLRWWVCHDNTAGAAKWCFDGADYTNGGTNPSGEITQFGSGLGTFAEEGNLYKYQSAGTSPGGTGSDYVVASFTLPASSFDIAGRSLTINADGGFANNTDAKRAKIIVGCTTATVGSVVSGGTTIADTGTYSTTGAVGWGLSASVAKYGAAGSNTQIAIHAAAQMGATVGSLLAPQALTLTESAAILVAVTLNCTTTASDATLMWATINAMN